MCDYMYYYVDVYRTSKVWHAAVHGVAKSQTQLSNWTELIELPLKVAVSLFEYSLNSSTLATSCKELTHWKTLWCWERLGAGGEGDDGGWDGWMASPTRWTWVWVNSRRWWWTGRPGVLQFMGSQRVGHDWVTELNYSLLEVGTNTNQLDCFNSFAQYLSVSTFIPNLPAVWPHGCVQTLINFLLSQRKCSFSVWPVLSQLLYKPLLIYQDLTQMTFFREFALEIVIELTLLNVAFIML